MEYLLSCFSSSVQAAESNLQLVLVVAVLLSLSAWVLYKKFLGKDNRNLPPGPRPWPIVGNFPSITGDLPHRVFHKLAQKYGGLMFLRLGSLPCIIVSSADVMKEVFERHDTAFLSRAPSLAAEVITGYKMFTFAPYGPYWSRMRRVCHTQLFTPKRLASFEHIRTDEVHRMMRAIRELAQKGETINLKKWLMGITSNNMTRMVLSKRYFCRDDEEDEDEAQQFQLMITNVLEIFVTFHIEEFIPSLKFLTKLRGWEKRALEVRQEALSMCARMLDLAKRKQRRQEAKDDSDSTKYEDLVDVLMSIEDGEEPLSDEALMISVLMDLLVAGIESTAVVVECTMTELIQHPDIFKRAQNELDAVVKDSTSQIHTIIYRRRAADLLVAGTESTAVVVEWAMAELIRHPDILKRAQNELDAVVGSDRVVQESDLPNLPYLRAIVKEVFRLHAPSPFTVPRISSREVEIDGHKVPAGTRLIVNLYSVHRDPHVYENPHGFHPGRFCAGRRPTVSASPERSSFELVPFGVGRRACAGSAHGDLMVHITLAHILHTFDWSLPCDEDPQEMDMSEGLGAITPKKTPLVLVARPRHPVSLH